MARLSKKNKWIPIIKGIEMTELNNSVWETVECNTKEEAEKLENKYYEFWNK